MTVKDIDAARRVPALFTSIRNEATCVCHHLPEEIEQNDLYEPDSFNERAKKQNEAYRLLTVRSPPPKDHRFAILRILKRTTYPPTRPDDGPSLNIRWYATLPHPIFFGHTS